MDKKNNNQCSNNKQTSRKAVLSNKHRKASLIKNLRYFKISSQKRQTL